jgi:UDP-2,3-diacylglucosamine pyrophosphatase LpxH
MQRFRALFISDVHMGTKTAQVDLLLEFLKYNEAETIYLVGDIVDGWRLKQVWYWPQNHNDLIQKLLRRARKGTKILFIPGNHDEFLRDYYGTHFGGIEIVEKAIHLGADGQTYLITHGDQFDSVVMHARWLAMVGDWAYMAALYFNDKLNIVRRRLGFTYWSFSSWAKSRVKQAVSFISAFEDMLAAEAKRAGARGVVCGHIHRAAKMEIKGMTYMNCGDWVESCTALVETEAGEFRIIEWNKERAGVIERFKDVPDDGVLEGSPSVAA